MKDKIELSKEEWNERVNGGTKEETMKASELRIGNLIIEDGRQTEFNGDFYYWIDGSIKPIQITEDWLLKFGFKKVVFDSEETGYGTEYHLTVKGLSGFIIEYMEDFSCCVLGDENDIGVAPNIDNCKYVHKLQNLYFALTGEELKIKEDEKI